MIFQSKACSCLSSPAVFACCREISESTRTEPGGVSGHVNLWVTQGHLGFEGEAKESLGTRGSIASCKAGPPQGALGDSAKQIRNGIQKRRNVQGAQAGPSGEAASLELFSAHPVLLPT